MMDTTQLKTTTQFYSFMNWGFFYFSADLFTYNQISEELSK